MNRLMKLRGNVDFYTVKYEVRCSIPSLISVEPYSRYIENMFDNGSLLYSVSTEDDGKFKLDLWMDEETGDFELEGKFKYRGWCEVEI